jgi:hypothetical protein
MQEANEYIGEIIEYKEGVYVLRNNIYTITNIHSEYMEDEQLWQETVGSGTPGLRFSKLGITNLNEIRYVFLKLNKIYGVGVARSCGAGAARR